MNSVRSLVLLIAVLEFIAVLAFLLPIPLGPDLAVGLAFSPDQLGWLTTAHTAAAFLAGALGLVLLDRFDRRQALLCSLFGLSLGLLLASFAATLGELLATRLVTGFFSAPAVAVGMAIVIDETPPAERGRAMSSVMAAVPLAMVLGVPAALEISRLGGWSLPFAVMGGLGFLLWVVACICLPAMRAHLAAQALSLRHLLSRAPVRLACALQGVNQLATFLIVPSFSAFFVLNLGYPRAALGQLYLIGGLFTFCALKLCGSLCDRQGPLPSASLATVLFVAGLMPLAGMVQIMPLLFFVCFMVGNAVRNMSIAVCSSHLPAAHERAGFMALQQLVQNIAVALSALIAAQLLDTGSHGVLTGMPLLAGLAAAAASLAFLLLVRLVRSMMDKV